MNIRWKALLLNLAVPLALGSLIGFFTRDGMQQFSALDQPPLSPPGWIFPLVWTALYLMMGTGAYIIYTRSVSGERKKEALRLYGWQLAVNLVWPVLFFSLGWHGTAFCWLVLLWVLILRTIGKFRQVDGRAAALLLPYLLWVSFAGYLNLGIALLN